MRLVFFLFTSLNESNRYRYITLRGLVAFWGSRQIKLNLVASITSLYIIKNL